MSSIRNLTFRQLALFLNSNARSVGKLPMVSKISEEYTRRSCLNENKAASQILKIINSKEAYEILDDSKATGTSFGFGGCWILADALCMYYGLPLYVVYNKNKRVVEHFMVKLNSMFLDSNGHQTDSEIIQNIASLAGCEPEMLDINLYVHGMDSSDIPKDSIASTKLMNLFSK